MGRKYSCPPQAIEVTGLAFWASDPREEAPADHLHIKVGGGAQVCREKK